MSGKRNWARDKARKQTAVALRDALDREAYLKDIAQARRVIPSKAELRALADAAMTGKLPGKGPWSPWRELGADDRVPMTGEVYSAIALGGWMWQRSR